MKRFTAILMAAMISLFISCEEENQPQEPFFKLQEISAEVPAQGGELKVVVLTNVEYQYDNTSDWIKDVEVKEGKNTFTHVYQVEPNETEKSRTAVLTFCANKQCMAFTVTQASAQL